MITRQAPQDYIRRKPLFPQTTRVCFRCGGTCVCLPILGVACLNCHGKKFITVPDSQVIEWRAEIEKANRYATFPAYTTGPAKNERIYSTPLQRENADGTYTQEFDDFSDADPGL